MKRLILQACNYRCNNIYIFNWHFVDFTFAPFDVLICNFILKGDRTIQKKRIKPNINSRTKVCSKLFDEQNLKVVYFFKGCKEKHSHRRGLIENSELVIIFIRARQILGQKIETVTSTYLIKEIFQSVKYLTDDEAHFFHTKRSNNETNLAWAQNNISGEKITNIWGSNGEIKQ